MTDKCMPEPTPYEESWIVKRRKDKDSTLVMPMPSREYGQTDDRALLADVAFNRHSMNDGHHVSPSDNGIVNIGTDGIRVALAQGLDVEQLKKTLSMATRATIGMDLSQTLPGDWEHCQRFCDWVKERRASGRDWQKYTMPNLKCPHDEHDYTETLNGEPHYTGKVPFPDWEEMLKGGLQTALETQVIVLAVSGVSRTCTHQLVRSRKASFHQQSQRASYMGDAPECRMPESVWKNPIARNAFLRSVLVAWRAYREICDQDISYQDARFVLPEGTDNFILLEYTLREFLNVYQYRACSMFQWEIVEVMRKAKDVLVADYPWLEPYIKISCEKTGPAVIQRTIPTRNLDGFTEDEVVVETVPHHCTFQGWEDVEGQCDFSWAKHEARTFKPQFHRISRDKESS